ncbi:putative capsular polysaccharide synthesis family protein [Microbulbifer sp. SAOS-129_SWC]|uniref:putative capsular polysaccharide synthesis family protein n=1 Tax=Microbulbifer sp. SAOS-129_SWC TaxID=3145235 RepID=UPI0032171586
MKNPVLIYQMGKVGSAAIRDSLNAIGYPNYQVHYLRKPAIEKLEASIRERGEKTPPHIARSKEVIDLGILEKGVKVITLMRDPVARNVSAFFQNINSYFPNDDYRDVSSGALIDKFISSYSHNVSTGWFSSEFKHVMGLDVTELEELRTSPYYALRHDGRDILLMKVESSDSDKKECLRAFLELDDEFELLRTNIGNEKSYKDQYRQFLKKIVLPKEYLDAMYGSAVVRAFYQEEEIESMRSKWTR